MNFYDVVSECAKNRGTSVRHISLTLGHSENYISNLRSMERKTSVPNAARILNECGYALCAVPKECLSDDMLEIDQS